MPAMKQDPLEGCLAARLLLTALLLFFCLPLALAGAWIPFGFSACMVLVLVFFSGRLEYRRIARAERAFLSERAAMSDNEFLRRMDAEPDLAFFYLAGRRAMAELDGIPAEMVRPDDTLASLMALQFDNGFAEDFMFALQEQLATRLPWSFPACCEKLTFATLLKELAHRWQRAGRIVLRVDPTQLANPQTSLCRVLADAIAERSRGSIQCEGYKSSADQKAMLVLLWAQELEAGVACVKEAIETIRVLDNDLRRGVRIAIERNVGYNVVFAPGHPGPIEKESPNVD